MQKIWYHWICQVKRQLKMIGSIFCIAKQIISITLRKHVEGRKLILPADLIIPHSYLTGSKSLLSFNVILILACRQHLQACHRQKIDAACGFNTSTFIFDRQQVIAAFQCNTNSCLQAAFTSMSQAENLCCLLI